jgi:hypothetical protein
VVREVTVPDKRFSSRAHGGRLAAVTSAIPKEIVSGRMMARIPQTKVTVLQTINHGDAFFTEGAIDSMFIRVTDRSSEFFQPLELLVDYIARRGLN